MGWFQGRCRDRHDRAPRQEVLSRGDAVTTDWAVGYTLAPHARLAWSRMARSGAALLGCLSVEEAGDRCDAKRRWGAAQDRSTRRRWEPGAQGWRPVRGWRDRGSPAPPGRPRVVRSGRRNRGRGTARVGAVGSSSDRGSIVPGDRARRAHRRRRPAAEPAGTATAGRPEGCARRDGAPVWSARRWQCQSCPRPHPLSASAGAHPLLGWVGGRGDCPRQARRGARSGVAQLGQRLAACRALARRLGARVGGRREIVASWSRWSRGLRLATLRS